MTRKRILILGASEEMIPLMKLAGKEGYKVLATDRNHDSPGLREADVSFHMDASDFAAVISIARQYHIDAITTRTELLLPVVAAVCDVLQLPGPSQLAAALSVDKYLFRQTMQQAGIRTPRFSSPVDLSELSTAVDHTGMPAIIKPVDYSGSTGVSLIKNADEAFEAFTKAKTLSPSGRVIVEEFITGKEFSIETWTQHRQTHIVAFTEKIVSGNNHFVELRHTIPATLTSDEMEGIRSEIEKMAIAMDLDNSIAHTEVFLTPDGPVIIETGARPGGDLIAFRLVEMATGISMYEVMFNLATGQPVPDSTPGNRAAAIQYTTSDNIEFIESIHELILKYNNLIEFRRLLQDNPGKLECSADRIAYYLFSAGTIASLRESLSIFGEKT